jgi:vancomycin resistance protein YoaR
MSNAVRTPPPSYARQAAPASDVWMIRVPILFAVGALLTLLTLTAFVAAFAMRYTDTIYPNIYAMSVNLSGMTVDEAAAALVGQFTYDEEAVFTFRDGDRFWQMTATELGVMFDARATAERAFALGHGGDMTRDLMAAAGAWFNGRSVAPVVNYDQSVAVARLQAIADEIDRYPQDATLTLNNGQATTTPSLTGRQVDIAATLARLDEIVMRLGTGAEIGLVIHETPPAIYETFGAAQRVQTALSAPINITATDAQGAPLGPWTITTDQIAALLSVQLVDNGDGTRQYAVSVDMSAFEEALAALAPGLITPPVDGRFHFNEQTAQLEVIQSSRDGRTLNVGDTLTRLEAAVFDPANRSVELAFDYAPPRYPNGVSAAQLGITELVSTGTTYYRGSSAARRTNIAVSAAQFDGIIIAPGEEFSYNYYLGEIEESRGFVDALVIVGDQTEQGIGGGTCQVSTTVYQAAYYAGYPIVELHAHAYRVPYYESGEGAGMDASIYQPEYDFRFLNDTPYHLLIEVDLIPAQDAVQFRFYSTNPGRRVVREGPVITEVTSPGEVNYVSNAALSFGQAVQVDVAVEGAVVENTRVILDLNGNEISRDVRRVRYQPWAAVFEVPPGDPRLGP